MVEREVVVIPCEHVCVNLVGPLPRAKGGYEHMLTCVDIATRWPEAVPIRCTTVKLVIEHLTRIFARTGFLGTIVTDNGPQFVAKEFQRFCTKHGIGHVKAAPLSLQRNGLVERMHRTLKSTIAKAVEGKGDLAEVVHTCHYFMRIMPSVSSGVYPFLLKYGWEQVMPIRLMYKNWVQDVFGETDGDAWLVETMGKVQALRDRACANYHKVSKERKSKWDEKAMERSFDVGDKSLYRTPSLDTQLLESWVGPIETVKSLGPLSYQFDVGSGKLKTAHIRYLNQYREKEVKTITSVLEDDKEDDFVEDGNNKVELCVMLVNSSRKRIQTS